MANMTMCDQNECKLCKTCLRFMANPNEYGQAYFSENPRDSEGNCLEFIPINQLPLF